MARGDVSGNVIDGGTRPFLLKVTSHTEHHSTQRPWSCVGSLEQPERRKYYICRASCTGCKFVVSLSHQSSASSGTKNKNNKIKCTVTMLSSVYSKLRNTLSPQAALELANEHLENARKTKNPEIALEYCNDAEKALAHIRTSVRKTCVSSTRAEDQSLCNEIATAYFELGELLDSLGRRTKAQVIYKNGEKWGYVSDNNILC
ncbi:hypothetical protein EDD21DRAFT_353908 [Dissophora ornata]|nr:hypothetical protein EDD21DRAFT_353908 [Dissophora ornata]